MSAVDRARRELETPKRQALFHASHRAFGLGLNLSPAYDLRDPARKDPALVELLEALRAAAGAKAPPGLWAALGRVEHIAGDPKKARAAFDKASDAAPDDRMASAWRALTFPDDASRAFELGKVLEKDGAPVWARLWRAACLAAERPETALEDAREALSIGGAAAHAVLGACLAATGKGREAAAEYGKAEALDAETPAFGLLAGLALFRAGDRAAAEKALSAWRKRHPKAAADRPHLRVLLDSLFKDLGSAAALSQRARAWMVVAGAVKEALADLDAALELDPGLRRARIQRAKYRELDLDLKGALEDLDKLLVGRPDAAVKLKRGELLRLLDTHEKAIEELNDAIDIDPELAQAYAQRAENEGGLGDYEKAAEDLTKAISLKPRNGKYHAWRGAAYVRGGKAELARADFKKAAALEPGFVRTYLWWGDLEFREGKHAKALELLDKAVQLDPKEEWSFVKRFQVLKEMGDFKRAIADLDASVRFNSRYSWCYTTKRDHDPLKELEGRREGLRQLEEAAAKDPRSPSAHAWLGETRLGLGDATGALEALDAALALDPKHGLALIWKGDALSQLGRDKEALAAYDAGIKREPEYARGRVGRGVVRSRLGDVDGALADFDRGIAQHFVEAVLGKSKALEGAGRLAEALAVVESCTFINDWQPAEVQRAHLLELLGRGSEAEESLSKLRKSDPSLKKASDVDASTRIRPILAGVKPKGTKEKKG